MKYKHVLIGWRNPKWLNAVSTYFNDMFATEKSHRAPVVCLDEIDLLHKDYLGGVPLNSDTIVLVMVRPLANDLIQVAEHLVAARLWTRVDVAVVDCRTDQIASVIDSVMLFPRWPVAWWPPYDDFLLNRKAFIGKLLTRRKQRQKMRPAHTFAHV